MLIWIDTETSGLSPKDDHLLEIAVVVTDDNLVEKASYSTVVKPVGAHIDDIYMDPVVRAMHSKNGLIQELRDGRGLRRYMVMEEVKRVLDETFAGVADVALDKCARCGKKQQEHTRTITHENVLCPDGVAEIFRPKRVSALSQTPLAGSTVGFDRGFLQEHLPEFLKLISYRNVDVSSITELAKRWAPKVYERRPKKDAEKAHRALADVRESVDYLRFYLAEGFITSIKEGL